MFHCSASVSATENSWVARHNRVAEQQRRSGYFAYSQLVPASEFWSRIAVALLYLSLSLSFACSPWFGIPRGQNWHPSQKLSLSPSTQHQQLARRCYTHFIPVSNNNKLCAVQFKLIHRRNFNISSTSRIDRISSVRWWLILYYMYKVFESMCGYDGNIVYIYEGFSTLVFIDAKNKTGI